MNVDTRGLRGGPIEWTADNHYRKETYYKVYRWDREQERHAVGRRLDEARDQVRGVAGPGHRRRRREPLRAAGGGYVLVYRATRVLNLAQGDCSRSAATSCSAGRRRAGPASVPSVARRALSRACSIYRLLMRPMAGHPIFAAVLVTVTLGILLRAAIVLVYTDRIRHPLPLLGLANPPCVFPAARWSRRSTSSRSPPPCRCLRGCSPSCASRRSGSRCAPPGERALLAAQRGINFQPLFALSWALAAFAGALAGILYANNVRLDPSLGVLGLKAFAVALVGGARQPGRRHSGRAHRGRRRGAVRPLRRSAPGRRLAVPLPARHAARPAVGTVRYAKSWSG